jgi:glycosyltransferase involved in cell wall biosynthesis
VPTYNVSPTIKETLVSILAQSYSNIKLNISDNASTDETLKIVESMSDVRINVHRQINNTGAEANFTKCIQLAEGKYTAIFHADDIYDPDIVEKQVAYLEDNLDVGAVFTRSRTIDEEGNVIGLIGLASNENSDATLYNFKELLKAMLLHHNFLVCPSAMVRTDIYKNNIVEWGSNVFRSSSDIDTWLRLSRGAPIAILNQTLMSYRISGKQYSEKIRTRTERTDFFLVMDNYLSRPDVIDFLDSSDFRHYRWLERHESVARALNLYIGERYAEAESLLSGFFCMDTFFAALHSRRGLVTMLGGSLLRFILKFGLRRNGINFIKKIKKIDWK